ncbi:hypothetical protein [Oscillatoria sp. HE19RPO]|uniref:hypothetical protein n=1 Tax=Oscillatoria sp. HE19RPO TaxID=2954806 RepID=UPI0020C53180|nr:hypothetical protein [Oscillatoria sp. HE19RPO]
MASNLRIKQKGRSAVRPGLFRKETRTRAWWGYTNKARLRGLKHTETRTLEGWGYTNEARLRGLKKNFNNQIGYQSFSSFVVTTSVVLFS